MDDWWRKWPRLPIGRKSGGLIKAINDIGWKKVVLNSFECKVRKTVSFLFCFACQLIENDGKAVHRVPASRWQGLIMIILSIICIPR